MGDDEQPRWQADWPQKFWDFARVAATRAGAAESVRPLFDAGNPTPDEAAPLVEELIRHLRARGGLGACVAEEIVAGKTIVAAQSNEVLDQLSVQQDERRAQAVPWLDAAHEAATREVATWLTGGWGSKHNEQAAQTVLELHGRDAGSPWGHQVMCRRLVPGWMSDLEMAWVDGQLPAPNRHLVGAVRRYLQHGQATAEGVDAETRTWGLEFLWSAELASWSEALDTIRVAQARVRELVGGSARCGPHGGRDEVAHETALLIFEVLDAMFAHGISGEMHAFAREVITPCHARLQPCRHADDLAAILEVAAEGGVSLEVPPVELLHDLIASGCHRSAVYLVLLHFSNRAADFEVQPITKREVAALKVAYKAAITTFSTSLLRAFYPTVRDALARGGLPVGRTDDLQALNDMAIGLGDNGRAAPHWRAYDALG